MKKNYMRPESMVVKIEVSKLVMVSDPDLKVNSGSSVDAANVESREFDDWDD